MTGTIVYRHTLSCNGCEFYRLKADALAAFRRTEKNGITSRVEALFIPGGKEGLVQALNLALGHPSNWEGEVIAKSKPRQKVRIPKTARRS